MARGDYLIEVPGESVPVQMPKRTAVREARQWVASGDHEAARLVQNVWDAAGDNVTETRYVFGVWRDVKAPLSRLNLFETHDPDTVKAMTSRFRLTDWGAEFRQRHGDVAARRKPAIDAIEAEYRAFVKQRIAELGLGFHPDTIFENYVEDDGRPVYKPAVAAAFQAIQDKGFDLLGGRVHAIAYDEMRPLIRRLRRR